MNEETRQAMALLRHQIISPVLMENRRTRNKYFREISNREFDVPGQGKKRFSAKTMNRWLLSYKRRGFKSLLPKQRADMGTHRKLKLNETQLVEMRRECMDMGLALFYRRAKTAGLLGDPPVCYGTILRFLKMRQLIEPTEPSVSRRKYEMGHFGELWVGDFMHGPELVGITRNGREFKKKAILLAIIDDHSRLIVGSKWAFCETTHSIETVFKDAILMYGKPNRLYVDNGPSFSGRYLRLVCAHLGIALIHSKPYDSPSRGKIERFFRTVREGFLIDAKAKTLSDINSIFAIWLRDEYHHRHHHGIDCKPIERYQRSIHDYPRARVSEHLLDEYFMDRFTRRVKKDRTIAFKGMIYEVPAKYINQKVEIRFRQDNPRQIYLYENGQCVTPLKVVDAYANAKSYKPRQRDTVIAYQEKEE